ncbi:MAG: hypothetical protein SFV15_25455 [Polyangiaceae bacterium]|nr:hypothetical protein [Polyangiaceae bacterium]
MPSAAARRLARNETSSCHPVASCANAAAGICLDFEDGQLPNGWEVKGQGITVDGVRSANGSSKSLHIAVPESTSGGKRIYLHKPAFDVPGTHIWGRFYMYLTPTAPNNHGSFVSLAGKDIDGADSKYDFGVQFERFMANFVRKSPFKELVTECRKAGNGCSASDAEAARIPLDAWSCVEWEFNGTEGKATQVSVNGITLKLDTYGTPTWFKMASYDTLDLGVIMYWPHAAFEAFIDDVAIGTSRIGCY